MKRVIADQKSVRLSRAAGWIAVGIGAVHVVVAPLELPDVWSQVGADGVWNTFTLDKPTTLSEHERAGAFWTTFGSFGVPILAFGSYVVWSTRQGHRVPGWLGWILLAWGVPFVIVLPASPGWAFPVIGGLIVLGDRRRSRSISEHGPHVVAVTDQPVQPGAIEHPGGSEGSAVGTLTGDRG